MNIRIVILTMALLLTQNAKADTTINSTYKWAWSSGAGWINGRTDSTNGISVFRNVCSGYLYSASAGWISLGNGSPTNGYRYCNSSSTDYGVNIDNNGYLSGYAWSGSFGWIDFGWTNAGATNSPKIDLKNGIFSGYAWGGSLGWISLSNALAWLKTDYLTNSPDLNGNGIPDAWELANLGSTNILKGGTNDADHDGVSDYNEYLAGSNPTNANDFFHLVDVFPSNGTNLQLRWTCNQSRIYKIEKKDDLMDTGGWQVVTGFTSIAGESDSNMVKTISLITSTQRFFRIQVYLPLSR